MLQLYLFPKKTNPIDQWLGDSRFEVKPDEVYNLAAQSDLVMCHKGFRLRDSWDASENEIQQINIAMFMEYMYI